MEYEVMFVSKTGNTEELAKAIFQAIPNKSKEIQRLDQGGKIAEADTYFIGFWTNRGTCSLEILDFLSELHGKNIALFGTCGLGNDPQYYHRIEQQLCAWVPDDNRYMGIFMCQGKMPMQIRSKYEAMLEQGGKDDIAIRMIRNFDEALLHPNAEDYKNADIFVKRVVEKLTDFVE